VNDKLPKLHIMLFVARNQFKLTEFLYNVGHDVVHEMIKGPDGVRGGSIAPVVGKQELLLELVEIHFCLKILAKNLKTTNLVKLIETFKNIFLKMTLLLVLGGYLIYFVGPFISEALIVLLYILFGLRYYIITGGRETSRNVLKILHNECHAVSVKNAYGKEFLSGYCFGHQCIGYIDKDDTIHILTLPSFYKRLMTEEHCTLSDAKSEPDIARVSIQVFTRMGLYSSFYYRSIKLDVSHIRPIGCQIAIVEHIVDLFKSNGRTTVFLHGISGAGKSTIGYLVAKELRATFCHTFRPTDPGDTFAAMIRETLDEKPLVVVMEEVDVILHSIHDKTISVNPKIPTEVRDKGTWSTLLDDMIFFKKVVLILTSNESKESLDLLDPSYLRKGRIDASYAMLKELQMNE